MAAATASSRAGVSTPDPELHYFSRFYDRGDNWHFSQFPEIQGPPLT
jgi:hypothetical protein